MIVLGLTGSIGMGKSTTAKMFADAGIPIHDSDSAVHRLYAGAAAPLVEQRFPGVTTNGIVDRARLAEAVLNDPPALRDLEAIVHPLVRAEEQQFLTRHRKAGAPLVVLDIPLLFEVGAQDRVDKVAVVTAPPDIQRQRVLARSGMTEAKFEAIRKKQVADAEKRRRADFVIDSSGGIVAAREAVRGIIAELTATGR